MIVGRDGLEKGCVRRKPDPVWRSGLPHSRLGSLLFPTPTGQERVEAFFASIAPRLASRVMQKSPGLPNPNPLKRSSLCTSAIGFSRSSCCLSA